MRTVRHATILFMLQWLAAFAWAANGGADDAEFQIKAAYLYKFAAYVDWPPTAFAEANTPIIIGVIGADDIAAELKTIRRGRTVNNRAVEIKVLKPGEPLTGVRILFVGGRDGARLRHVLDNVQSQPVLTVTDSPGALGAGSIINFVPVDDRIRFEVSVQNADLGGLKISARLLNVAQKIEARRP